MPVTKAVAAATTSGSTNPSSANGPPYYTYQPNIADQTIVEVDEPPPEVAEVDVVDSTTQVPKVKWRRPQPVFLDADRRQFANPISYLGGPRWNNRNSQASSRDGSASSLDSLMSLD
ncbi:hypothetical protein pipiens_007739 [Culex pipiens pipiens]|uniref:Uncharacterized protein n=1 Tax=Culex pipiens pipiens TaxID=38569 RepID=A0ABD1DJZ7_CULPP